MEEVAAVMELHPLADGDSGEMPILSQAAKLLMLMSVEGLPSRLVDE